MTDDPVTGDGIQRTFRDLSDEEVADIGRAFALARRGWPDEFGWDQLLKSRRILIVSEAGAGKTFECHAQRDQLWAAGEPAFFFELAVLANTNVREMLSNVEEERFDAWLRAQSELATFFLDSYDELQLGLGSFDQALRRFSKAIGGQLGRARIIVTTRPVPMDRQLIQQHLPLATVAELPATADSFATAAMRRSSSPPPDSDAPKPWRNVGLMPLSENQIKQMARIEHLSDEEADALLADIRRRDAEEFARRPQDLIELCADWRDHRRIRTHSEQVASNIATKLKPRTDRAEKAQLSHDKAIDGACRLALAAMLTRRLTFRHSAESDRAAASEAALDVGLILPNWTPLERKTLLERALFGFASYGRVRFHHRSVVEFLAAKRLDAMLERGDPVKSIKRLLFAETMQGEPVVRPSMRPVGAWLALWRDPIFEEIKRREPAVLLDNGDPQSLSPSQRLEALKAYVRRYGQGGWRGLDVPRIQVHRVATEDLARAVIELWNPEVENPEVRDLLLGMIEVGRFKTCSDIAFSTAMDTAARHRERLTSLRALASQNDSRLEQIVASIETDPACWPDDIARPAILVLFPEHIDTGTLCRILRRVREPRGSIGDLSWQLPNIISEAVLPVAQLDVLRAGLTELVSEGAAWSADRWPRIRGTRPHLVSSLAAICVRQLREILPTADLLRSCALAIRFVRNDSGENGPTAALREALAHLPRQARETLFWADDSFLQTCHKRDDPWMRVYEVGREGSIQLIAEQDDGWVRAVLADRARPELERAMMLWAELILINRPDQGSLFLESLKPLVADSPALTAILEARLNPPAASAEWRKMEARSEKARSQAARREAKDHASWVKFWREVAKNPDLVFGADRADNTAWNLWKAMSQSGNESRASGWSRRFVEHYFGKDVADRLRCVMMTYWRRTDPPTLRSERPEEKKNTYFTGWQFGLAAIAAEAEDAEWAKKLSDVEARIAARYAPVELNGFPSWLGSLVEAHPSAVDAILGAELSLSLAEPLVAGAYPMFLQDVSYAAPRVAALFVPRIKNWLEEQYGRNEIGDETAETRRLSLAVDILLKSDEPTARRHLKCIASQELAVGLSARFAFVWLPVLMQLDPDAGIGVLERGLRATPAAQYGEGVKWFGCLFGRDSDTAGLRVTSFTPAVLLRLTRLVYEHVRPAAVDASQPLQDFRSA